MLKEKKLKEIQDHLDKAQNPLFFFDNDQDGLCSYLLFRRFLGRGKGIPVKSHSLDKNYLRRINEFSPDYIFILDVPVVDSEFFTEIEKINLPVVWIDHHYIEEKIPSFVNYYNSFLKKEKFGEPVTSICFEVVKNKKESWLGVVGCISDKFLPNFYPDFFKQFPELAFKNSKNLVFENPQGLDAFDVFYNSEIGKIAQMFGAGLKDKTTNVMQMIRFLIKVKNPHEVLEDNSDNSSMHKRFNELDFKLKKLLEKAKTFVNGNGVLFFTYSGDTSMSSDLANLLVYKFKKKLTIVCYINANRVNVSVRGKAVKSKILKLISDFETARGGGHEDALGLQISLEDLEKFKERVEKSF